MTTIRALAVIGALVAGLVVFAQPIEALTESDWYIVGPNETCDRANEVTFDDGEQRRLRRDQTICLAEDVASSPESDESVFQLAESDGPLVELPEGQLRISPGWRFDAEKLRKDEREVATFRLSGDDDAGEQSVIIVPEIMIEIIWEEVDLGDLAGTTTETTEALTTTTGATTSSASGATTVAPTTTTEPEDHGGETQVIGPSGIRKVVQVSGLDKPDLTDDTVRGQLVIVDPLPKSLIATDLPRDDELSATLDRSYRTAFDLRPSAEPTSEELEQTTRLEFDGQVVATSSPYRFVVTPPTIALAATAVYSEDQSGAMLEVTVKNESSAPVAGPIKIVVEPAADVNLIGFKQPSDGWSVSGSILTWELADGLRRGDTIRTAIGDVARSDDETTVKWDVRLEIPVADGEAEILAETETTTTVPAKPDSDAGPSVDFDAGELVQLIVFVVTLALIAIIIGASIRRSRSPHGLVGSEANEQRKHEESIFRAYIEGIIVLVILVSILVLALQRSLEAESAASLIGVIAGYVLGQRRGG